MELEELYKKFEELPENIREALLAPETASSIYEIGKSANLEDEKISLLAELVGNVFMEGLKESDLSNKIKVIIEADDVAAKNLSIKIDKVIKFIQSRPVVRAKEETEEPEEGVIHTDTKIEEKNALQKENTPLKPDLIREPQLYQKQKLAHDAPFILHQEEEITTEEHQAQQYAAPRPVFYKPTFSEEYKRDTAPPTAKLELGPQEEGSGKEPRLARTPLEETRVVHYSELVTPVDPFGSQEQMPAAAPAMPTEKNDESTKQSPEVHPNNVVDLKDLPL